MNVYTCISLDFFSLQYLTLWFRTTYVVAALRRIHLGEKSIWNNYKSTTVIQSWKCILQNSNIGLSSVVLNACKSYWFISHRVFHTSPFKYCPEFRPLPVDFEIVFVTPLFDHCDVRMLTGDLKLIFKTPFFSARWLTKIKTCLYINLA